MSSKSMAATMEQNLGLTRNGVVRSSVLATLVAAAAGSFTPVAKAAEDGRPHPRRPRSSTSSAASPPASTQPVPAPASPTATTEPKEVASSTAPAPAIAPLPTPVANPYAAAGAFYPPRLPTYGDLPPPPGYRVESSINGAFFYSGLVVFGLSYGVGFIYGAANGFDQGLGALAIPIAGPFIALGSRDLNCEVDTIDPNGDLNTCEEQLVREATAVGALAAIGMGQLVGGGLMVLGILDRDESWVRVDLGRHAAVELQPEFTAGGFGVRGRF